MATVEQVAVPPQDGVGAYQQQEVPHFRCREVVEQAGKDRAPEELPSWLAEADIDTLATEFTEAGFTSALSWYRNWQLTAPWEGAQYRMPGRYVTGDRDLVNGFPGMDQLIPALPTLHPGIEPAHILPGCGHCIAEEYADQVNATLLEFLGSLKS
ncbi:alpha/beta hydrolase [Streptomyces sp. NBC_00365]|uniref:alpha/beta fold hydrolase n=1 Tax=Streptomyces sp. NBC_00365 TaxID=2975726 RepID=UPI0022581225|nr:alpha/beta hydrolase [Streptomyces sp. NBC_00365]MCX5097192.1 alpha/beta hydrolase [Streptomyces sp. NBC_00365]